MAREDSPVNGTSATVSRLTSASGGTAWVSGDGARPCALRASVALYVTFEPTLLYSPRKQRFELFVLGELSHSCNEWQSEAGGGTTCLSAYPEVVGVGRSLTATNGQEDSNRHGNVNPRAVLESVKHATQPQSSIRRCSSALRLGVLPNASE